VKTDCRATLVSLTDHGPVADVRTAERDLEITS
jgi:hypothetical protein